MMAKAKSAATPAATVAVKPVTARKKPQVAEAKAAPATKPKTPKASGRTAKSPAAAKTKQVPDEQRAHYIEVAAFYIAERRGFTPGNPVEDWLAAEAEIDRLMATGRLG